MDLHNRRPVLRLIVDEAHYYFVDQLFRKHALENAYSLRHFPVQVVLMSGTISPAAERFLTEQFALHQPCIIRSHSSRKEISYCRINPLENTGACIEKIKEILMHTHLEPEDRYLIFVSYMDEGERVAHALDLEFYHASSKHHPITETERQARYNRWISGEYIGLIASSALAAGNDYPHVRLTIHVGNPYNAVTFIQQSGRAGRDGKPAVSWTLPRHQSNSIQKDKIESQYGDLSGTEVMRTFTHGSNMNQCLRLVLSQFTDGVAHDCMSLGENTQLCNVCISKPVFYHDKSKLCLV